MKVDIDCLSFTKSEADRIFIQLFGNAPDDQDINKLQESTFIEVESFLANVPEYLRPSEVTHEALKIILGKHDADDPFYSQKRDANQSALDLLKFLQQKVQQSTNAPLTAVLVAAIGNTFGSGNWHQGNIHSIIDNLLDQGFARSDFRNFYNRLSQTKDLLYLTENAGEIVFDRVLIESIKRDYPQIDISIGVHQTPYLYNTLREDALDVGLESIGEIIDNGTDRIGTDLSQCSGEFQLVFSTADLIVSKGQANFETLQGRPDHIYFILQAKCNEVAKALQVKGSSLAFVHS